MAGSGLIPWVNDKRKWIGVDASKKAKRSNKEIAFDIYELTNAGKTRRI